MPLLCPSCQSAVADGNSFCTGCGSPVGSAPSAPVPSHTAPTDVVSVPEPELAVFDAPVSSAVVGSQLNSTYLGQRLMYRTDIQTMDPLNNRKVFLELVRNTVIASLAVWVGVFAAFFAAGVFWVLSLINDSFSVLSNIAAVLGALALFGGMFLWIYMFFRRFPVANAEWEFLIDEKGAQADRSFAQVVNAFRRRETPVSSLRVKRMKLTSRTSRDMLEVRHGTFIGYVSCFPHGTDLYIGWAYYWNLSMAGLIWMGVRRMWNLLRVRGSEFHVLSQFEPAKAMREALHAAAREGMDVAVGVAQPANGGTIGSDIPIDVLDDSSPAFAAA